MQGLAAECMLARGVAYIRVQEADSMLARGGESI